MSKKIRNFLISFVAIILLVTGVIFAGEITRNYTPETTFYNLTDIYNKLTNPDYTYQNNASLSPSVSSDESTMFSLTDIFEAIPDYQTLDNSTTTISAGIYDTTNLSVAETDLSAINIAPGATIFGISGDSDCNPVE